MMNSLYTFFVVGKPCIFVAAPNWKEGRNIAYRDHFKDIGTLPEIEGFRVNVRCTQDIGIIPIEKVCSDYAWWVCRCGNRSFVALDAGDSCRCTQCGKEFKVVVKKNRG